MNRVIFGRPAAKAIVTEADRLRAKRVFILTGRTFNTKTDEIDKVRQALRVRFMGAAADEDLCRQPILQSTHAVGRKLGRQ